MRAHWMLYTPTVSIFFGKTSSSAIIFISALVDHVFRWGISRDCFVVGWRNLGQFNHWRRACTLTTKKTSFGVSPGVENTSLKAPTSMSVLRHFKWLTKVKLNSKKMGSSAERDSILCQILISKGTRFGLIRNTVLISTGLKKPVCVEMKVLEFKLQLTMTILTLITFICVR